MTVKERSTSCVADDTRGSSSIAVIPRLVAREPPASGGGNGVEARLVCGAFVLITSQRGRRDSSSHPTA